MRPNFCGRTTGRVLVFIISWLGWDKGFKNEHKLRSLSIGSGGSCLEDEVARRLACRLAERKRRGFRRTLKIYRSRFSTRPHFVFERQARATASPIAPLHPASANTSIFTSGFTEMMRTAYFTSLCAAFTPSRWCGHLRTHSLLQRWPAATESPLL